MVEVVKDEVLKLVDVGLCRRAKSGGSTLDGRIGIRGGSVGVRRTILLRVEVVRDLARDALAKLHDHGSTSERLSGDVESPCLDGRRSGLQDKS